MLSHLQSLAIHSYYAGELETGRRACDRILSMDSLPDGVEDTARTNRTFYTPTLDELAGVTFRRFDIEPAGDGWSLFNPAIISHGDGFLAIVRSSNYSINQGRYEMPAIDGGVIKTQNILVRLSSELDILDARTITGPTYPHSGYPVWGLEDCRLRRMGDQLGVSATVRNASGFDGRCRIGTADLDIETATLSNLEIADGLGEQEHEKNWMPIEDRGGWLYSCCHAGRTVSIDSMPDGSWVLARGAASPTIAKGFRGGSQLVPFHGGFLACIHEVAHIHGKRAYEHRLVWIDNGLTLRKMSPLFAFKEKQAIEFAAGLAVSGDRVVVSFGVRDAEAWTVEISQVDVWAMLYEIHATSQDRPDARGRLASA